MLALHALLLMTWLAACAIQDWRQQTISNVLTLGGLLVAVLYLLWNTSSWLGSPWPLTIAGILLSLLISVPGYCYKRFGAADVKLLLAIACATDFKILLITLIGAGLVFCVWALLQSFWRRSAAQPNRLTQSKKPYAPATFIGLAAALYISI